MKSELAIDALRHRVTSMTGDSLTPSRLAALAQLDENGLPTTTHEDWKYTDITELVDISNQWLADGADIAPVSDDAIDGITSQFDAAWLIVRNGIVDTDSVDNLRRSQIDVRLLSDAGTTPGFDAPLTDLNLALLRDGLAIRIVPAPMQVILSESCLLTVPLTRSAFRPRELLSIWTPTVQQASSSTMRRWALRVTTRTALSSSRLPIMRAPTTYESRIAMRRTIKRVD